MENIIHIGSRIDEKDAIAVAKFITDIFDSAFKNHMDQSTVVAALRTFSEVFKIENVCITDSNFVGEDKRVVINQADEE